MAPVLITDADTDTWLSSWRCYMTPTSHAGADTDTDTNTNTDPFVGIGVGVS